MVEVLGMDYVRSARAKGLSEARVIYHHSLKNAMILIVANTGLQLGYLLGGSVLTETVFVWPGMGRLAVQAISGRDFPVVQGVTLAFAASFVLINMLVDMCYMWLDPRLRYA
jgi:ABC-type dipeptide/oligopeptide/nickel transport system permease component